LSSHPEYFGGHSGFLSSSPFSGSSMSSSSLFFQISSGSGSGMDGNGFLHNQTVLHQFTDASSLIYFILLELANEIS
jgi:hypothetical protein